jgi:hypothetical protein
MRSRRQFLQVATAGLVALPACNQSGAPPAATSPAGRSRELLVSNPEHPRPSTLDRLPLEWHQQRARLLQERAGAS